MQENLSPELFQAPTLSAEGPYPWIFDYESKTVPKHLVRIYVDTEGKVERHRMIDEK